MVVGAHSEQCAFSGPPLGHSYELAATYRDLTRPGACKTDMIGEWALGHRSQVNGRVLHLVRSQERRPPLADPHGSACHVPLPQRVVSRQPYVGPDVVSGTEEHCATPGAPADDGDPRALGAHGIDNPVRLRASQHQSGVRRGAEHHRAPLDTAIELHIQPGCSDQGVVRGRATGFHRIALHGGAIGSVGSSAESHRCGICRSEAAAQDAVAKNGSQRGSTSARCRRRQRCPSGACGLKGSDQPSSESKWSPLMKLSRRHDATTFVHS